MGVRDWRPPQQREGEGCAVTYQGMDPDVVQRIGGDLQRVGAELNRMSNHIEILVRQIAQHWHCLLYTSRCV